MTETPATQGVGSPMTVLSFTTVFPRPGAPNLGTFVRSRLLHMARLCSLEVIAPVALIEYGNHGRRLPGSMPSTRSEGTLAVHHPRWFYLPGTRWLTPLFLAAAALRPVLRHRFDILDAHFGHPDGIAAALLAMAAGRPFAITLRGNETMHAQSAPLRKAMSWAFRRAGRVITVSARLRDFAIELGASPERVITIPNGIDPDVFYPRDRARCRAEIGMREGARHVVSAGYLIERKGHHLAIDAVAGLRGAGHDVELWIVGNPGAEGSVAEALRGQVERLGLGQFVHFVPAVPQSKLAEFMTAADLLCLASSREGWPNVVHEALACGTPVVASDVGGVPDMLPDAAYGYVVPIGAAGELRDAIGQAVQRDWDRQAIAAWGHARTWSTVAEEAVHQLEAAVREARAVGTARA